jgi:hypothetical protein
MQGFGVNLMGKSHLRDIVIDGSIVIIKWTLRKRDEMA